MSPLGSHTAVSVCHLPLSLAAEAIQPHVIPIHTLCMPEFLVPIYMYMYMYMYIHISGVGMYMYYITLFGLKSRFLLLAVTVPGIIYQQVTASSENLLFSPNSVILHVGTAYARFCSTTCCTYIHVYCRNWLLSACAYTCNNR